MGYCWGWGKVRQLFWGLIMYSTFPWTSDFDLIFGSFLLFSALMGYFFMIPSISTIDFD